MSRFTHQMTSYWQQMLSVMRNEFRTIFTDAGVVLILVLALIIYATVYSMAYGAQVLRNVPIGVVDECRTPTSRSLIDTFNAGPNTYVAYNPTSMEEAKSCSTAAKSTAWSTFRRTTGRNSTAASRPTWRSTPTPATS